MEVLEMIEATIVSAALLPWFSIVLSCVVFIGADIGIYRKATLAEAVRSKDLALYSAVI